MVEQLRRGQREKQIGFPVARHNERGEDRIQRPYFLNGYREPIPPAADVTPVLRSTG
jgi:hypothetical protein